MLSDFTTKSKPRTIWSLNSNWVYKCTKKTNILTNQTKNKKHQINIYIF
uniref:Uncharacterized protein n=1 Tax=Rhizophora mucronata TaxID=61149 RepID=A0A2P2N7T2_RHIMU